MKLRLQENIRLFRKERHLTQEGLSEILGVTPGAVYKWESGLSVPELSMIVEMADFFDVSVDTLLGYQLKDNRISSVMERLVTYCRTNDPAAIPEAEKALKKYPYSFEVVHECALVYMIYAYGEQKEYLQKAKELLERSLLLVRQNTDPRTGELTLYGELAHVLILSGEEEKGIEMMKQHNIGGIFDDLIGINLAIRMKKHEEGEKYLINALLSNIASLTDNMFGMVSVLCKRNELDAAMEMIQWNQNLISGLKKEEQKDFTLKITAAIEILKAHILLLKDRNKEAKKQLDIAADMVKNFDASPDYSINTLRFINVPDNVILHDTLGATAAESMDSIVNMLENPQLSQLWKERKQ